MTRDATRIETEPGPRPVSSIPDRGKPDCGDAYIEGYRTAEATHESQKAELARLRVIELAFRVLTNTPEGELDTFSRQLIQADARTVRPVLRVPMGHG